MISTDPRLPQLPNGQEISTEWFRSFRERFYGLWREVIGQIDELLENHESRLDVLEETGTWTPTDASGAGLTFTVTSATYSKIGTTVVAHCHIVFPVTVNGANAAVGGLPYAAAATSASAVHHNSAANPTVTQITGTSFNIFAAAAALTNAQLSGNFIVTECVYRTA